MLAFMCMAAGAGKFSISDSFMHSDTGAFREKFNFRHF